MIPIIMSIQSQPLTLKRIKVTTYTKQQLITIELYQLIREADYVLEPAIPREPTRAEEVAYLDWLENQFLHDKWIHPKTHKLMAGPKRWPFKNYQELKKQYNVTFIVHFGLGCLITYPFAIWVGRWFK